MTRARFLSLIPAAIAALFGAKKVITDTPAAGPVALGHPCEPINRVEQEFRALRETAFETIESAPSPPFVAERYVFLDESGVHLYPGPHRISSPLREWTDLQMSLTDDLYEGNFPADKLPNPNNPLIAAQIKHQDTLRTYNSALGKDDPSKGRAILVDELDGYNGLTEDQQRRWHQPLI